MNKTFKKLAAAALAALSLTSVMATTASAYKLDYDTVAYDYITINHTAADRSGHILNKSTLNNYAEITRSLIKEYQGSGWGITGYTADMYTDFAISSGKILGVLEAGLTVEEAYALASEMRWFDVNYNRMYVEMRYNKEVNRFYLVCSSGYSSDTLALNAKFSIDTNKQYKRANGAYADVMLKTVGCYPDFIVDVKEHTWYYECTLPEHTRVVKPEFSIDSTGTITVRWMDDNNRVGHPKPIDTSFSGTIRMNDGEKSIKNFSCCSRSLKNFNIDK